MVAQAGTKGAPRDCIDVYGVTFPVSTGMGNGMSMTTVIASGVATGWGKYSD